MASEEHEPIHVLVYGEPGAGKSTFAATFPNPKIVMMFDPMGKETPYLKKGRVTELVEMKNFRYRDILHPKKDVTITRVMNFFDADVTKPNAYEAFQGQIKAVAQDILNGKEEWKTLVVDSVTYMELAARKLHQYRLNATAREPRQWFAGSTELLEEALMMTLGALPCNVVLCAHVDEDKDELFGTFVRNPMAPGRLRKRLGGAFQEMYRAYVVRDEAGKRHWCLQTKMDERFNAGSQINPVDPCEPHYHALWEREKAGEE